MGRRRVGQMPRVAVVKPHNHARVRIGGKAYWLGACPDGRVTAAQEAEATRLWNEHVAGHKPVSLGEIVAAQEQATQGVGELSPASAVQSGGITVAAMMNRYLDHAERYYRLPDGTVTSTVDGIKLAARSVLPWANVPAASFGPRMLKLLRDAEVRNGRPRVTINRIAKTLRQAFKWASSEELVPAGVWQSLQSVPPLQKGRTEAPEVPPVEEVPEWLVQATLPFLSPVVAAMVELQRWTGARPGEIVILRPCDIDRRTDVWLYRPHHFKTDWREQAEPRVVPIGSEGQRVLLPYLLRCPEAFCFSPKEAEAARAQDRRAARKSPMTPSQARREPKRNGRRRPTDRYDTPSYRRAIKYAVAAANRKRASEGLEALPAWSPNQLRHLRAGELEESLGLEASSAVLGHRKVETTQIYARRKLQIAIDAVRRTG